MKRTKKCLIGFIIAIISIIPISSVSASDLPQYYEKFHNSTVGNYIYNYPNGIPDGFLLHYFDNFNNPIYHKDTVFSNYIEEYDLKYCLMWVGSGTWNTINYACMSSMPIKEESESRYKVENAYYMNFPIIYDNSYYYFTTEYSTPKNGTTYFNYTNDYPVYIYDGSIPDEYLSYDYELFNNNYYFIRFYTDNFNSNYKYQIKFDYNNSWVNINDYLSSGSYSYTLTKNSTLYMQVLNENGESIETKTMTFSDITYNEEIYIPTADIDVSYSVGSNNLAKANITINIKNYSPIYYYKYSFNDIEDNNINTSDIIDNKYSFEIYQNGTVYFYVYNQEGEVVYKTNKIIDSVLDNEIYYYYEFDMSKFYNESDNSINTLVFYYEEGETLINDNKVLPYVNMYLLGEDNKLLPFYITYSTDVIDVNTFSRNVNFDKSISQYLPYEKLFESKISYHNKSYTAYAVAPIMDLTNNTFEDYDSYKLVIRTTKKMSDNYFSFIGGVLLPQPNINTDVENYNTSKSIFDMFINPIKEKFPIFWQLPDVFNSLNFDKGDGTLPPVLVDFSFLGIDKELNVIDFSYFVEYRPYLFGILKVILAFYTLRNVNKNLNLGGGN